MAAIVLGSQALSRRAHRERVCREAQRVRSAVALSLPALRRLYEHNLSMLCGDELLLMSGRNQINILRTQLGRLTSLDPPEIEAIMAASIAAERAETAMALADRRVGAVAFAISGSNESRAFLRATLREACSTLETAEELLSPDAARACSQTRVPESSSVAEEDQPPFGREKLLKFPSNF